MQEFFYMGGYGFYIWTSYAIVLVAMLLNFIWPAVQRRRIISRLQQARERKEKLARRQQ